MKYKSNQKLWLTILRKLSVAAAAGLLAGCDVHITNSGFSGTDTKSSVTVQHAGAVSSGIKSVEIENDAGALTVTGTNGDSLQWSQNLEIHARTDADVQDIAKALTCRVETVGDRLKLTVTPPHGNQPASFKSDLTVIVPPGISVKTSNHYGATTISGLAGPLDASGESGSVIVKDVSETVHARTSYASLRVEHTGPASLSNVSGSIYASDIDGELSAETSYASIAVHQVKGAVNLHDTSGSVSADHTGPIDGQTSYASLRVSDIDGDVHLTDQSGSVTVDRVKGKVEAQTSYASMDVSGDGKEFSCTDESGSVRVHARSPALTRLAAHTSYASLEVWLPASISRPAIMAQTSYASVESEFPLLAHAKGMSEPTADSPQIILENQSGKIRVAKE